MRVGSSARAEACQASRTPVRFVVTELGGSSLDSASSPESRRLAQDRLMYRGVSQTVEGTSAVTEKEDRYRPAQGRSGCHRRCFVNEEQFNAVVDEENGYSSSSLGWRDTEDSGRVRGSTKFVVTAKDLHLAFER